MIKQLILLLVLISFSFSTFNEIVTLDCKKKVHFLPSSTFATGFDIKSIKMVNFFMNKLQEMMQCDCPDITTSDFNKHFNVFSLQNWFDITTKKITFDTTG